MAFRIPFNYSKDFPHDAGKAVMQLPKGVPMYGHERHSLKLQRLRSSSLTGNWKKSVTNKNSLSLVITLWEETSGLWSINIPNSIKCNWIWVQGIKRFLKEISTSRNMLFLLEYSETMGLFSKWGQQLFRFYVSIEMVNFSVCMG